MGIILPPPPPPPEPPPEPPLPDPWPPTPPDPWPEPPAPPEECPDIEPFLFMDFYYPATENDCEEWGAHGGCLAMRPELIPIYPTGCDSCPVAWYLIMRSSCVYDPIGQYTYWQCWWDFMGCSDSYLVEPIITYPDDTDAYKLAITYGLSPLESGKYEPDRRRGESVRSMILANWRDATNILIQYNPDELE